MGEMGGWVLMSLTRVIWSAQCMSHVFPTQALACLSFFEQFQRQHRHEHTSRHFLSSSIPSSSFPILSACCALAKTLFTSDLSSHRRARSCCLLLIAFFFCCCCTAPLFLLAPFTLLLLRVAVATAAAAPAAATVPVETLFLAVAEEEDEGVGIAADFTRSFSGIYVVRVALSGALFSDLSLPCGLRGGLLDAVVSSC